MKKKLLKFVAFLIAAVILLGIFAGCQGKTGAGADKSGGDGRTTAATAGASETENKPKPELKILIHYVNFDVKNDASVKLIEEATGYKVTYDTLPENNFIDKLNLLFSSGSMNYDYVILNQDISLKNAYATYAERGQLVELGDKIKNYPNISKIDPIAFEPVKVKGKIYAIGNTGLPYPNQSNVIRKDWLDAVAMDIPTDKDELFAVLKAFKEKDPGKQGDKNIPFVEHPRTVNPGIAAMFGFIYDYEVVDGKIVDMRLTENYRQYLEYMAMLYKEGLLDQDFPINKGSNVLQKMASGNAGFYVGWVDPGRDALITARKEGATGTVVMAIPPFKGPNGEMRTRSNIGGLSFGFIPKSSKNADAVLDWINTYLEPEIFEFLVNGKEGEDYTVKDGKRYPILPRFDEMRGNLWAFTPVQDGNSYYPLWQMRTRKQPEYSEVFESMVAVGDQYRVQNVLAFAPPFASTTQTVKIVDEYITQEATKFIAGARPLSEFDNFVQEVKAKGADEIVKEYNEWYLNSDLNK